MLSREKEGRKLRLVGLNIIPGGENEPEEDPATGTHRSDVVLN
jgi:hypothetical protein